MLSAGTFKPGRIAASLVHEVGREIFRLSMEDEIGVLCVDRDAREIWAGLPLAGAALCYSLSWEELGSLKIVTRDGDQFEPLVQFWPLEWDMDGYQALDRRASLIRAASLLLLEVARLDLAGESASALSVGSEGVQ